MAAQFLTISRLSNIINMITLGQQSGILRVIRGQGAGREVGQIKFTNGTPTSALLGQLTGTNAMSVLSNWGECVYSFEELPQGDSDYLAQSYDQRGDSSYPSYALNSGPLPNVPWPSYSFPSSAPPAPPATPAQMPTTNPLQGGVTSQPGYWPAQQGDAGYGYGGGQGYPQPGEYGSQPGSYGAFPGVPPTTDPLGSYTLRVPPRRTMLSDQIDQLPLDRRERMVLLLVDGQRNLADLARLTRRSERELLGVLDYLAGLGLVTLS